MARDHFAQMNRQTSHRHDSVSDSALFNEAMNTITGMLYSIVTLKAFFPSAPAPEMNNYPVKDAEGGDRKYEQLTLW